MLRAVAVGNVRNFVGRHLAGSAQALTSLVFPTRQIPKNGVAHLANYAVNLLAVEGGKTTIIMPDMTPGKREISVFDGTASVAFHKVARMAKSYWRYLRETN